MIISYNLQINYLINALGDRTILTDGMNWINKVLSK